MFAVCTVTINVDIKKKKKLRKRLNFMIASQNLHLFLYNCT